jgi:hypothetical protein
MGRAVGDPVHHPLLIRAKRSRSVPWQPRRADQSRHVLAHLVGGHDVSVLVLDIEEVYGVAGLCPIEATVLDDTDLEIVGGRVDCICTEAAASSAPAQQDRVQDEELLVPGGQEAIPDPL